MKYYLIILVSVFICGCSAHHQINMHKDSYLRRMPQMNHIDPGRPLKNGSFSASFNASYATKEPNLMYMSDSSLESINGLFGDKYTIITTSNTMLYESRMMLSGEGAYAFSDFFSSGFSFDMSLGKIAVPSLFDNSKIKNNNIEGSMFIRFAKQFGRFGVAVKPQFTIIHLYGDRLWTEAESLKVITTTTERLSFYTFSFGSSSVIRYDVIKNLAPFFGFQIKTQPYPKSDDKMDHEVCYGLYCGIDYRYRFMAFSPFATFPLGSSTSNFKSPISLGMQLSFIIEPK